jgi:hypothetical protein
LFETRIGLTNRIFEVLSGDFVGALMAGTLGALKGLFLAFPLAAILGLFRGRS